MFHCRYDSAYVDSDLLAVTLDIGVKELHFLFHKIFFPLLLSIYVQSYVLVVSLVMLLQHRRD